MNPNVCSIDSPLHHSVDREMSGYAEYADSDFDLKVIIQLLFLSLSFYFHLITFSLLRGLLFITTDLILVQNQSFDMVSDEDDDSGDDSSEMSSSSNSTFNPSKFQGIFVHALRFLSSIAVFLFI
jgi:hypothetical protein